MDVQLQQTFTAHEHTGAGDEHMVGAQDVLASTAAAAGSDLGGWYLGIAIGVVVLAAVVVLLLLLHRIVADIDEGVQSVWRTATKVAANTATTWQLRETAAALSAIRDEAVRHAELLEGQP